MIGQAVLIALALLAAPKTQKAPAPNDGGVPFQEIAQQQLAPGQCALFLWARTSPARRILMATQNPASARIALKGRTLDLPLTAWDGEAHMGIHEVQTFSANGVTITVRFDGKAREGLVGGLVAENGSVEIRDAEGWETVVPAAGMLACQPAG
ncbi:hypothetical protein GVN21_05395 [Caulobacter sp. SLTY]|uniref:hypothetical protein n=1 Tax=Caulobacter sp. SLTY TaxID=2683262 RepID=UPI0014122ABF|nr:hypothetical protein [Caulobacter sp. SLTY]NBB14798.1 hypothetical protein [Caulobacter sp. SLTY]